MASFRPDYPMPGIKQLKFLLHEVGGLIFPARCCICQDTDCQEFPDLCDTCYSHIPYTRLPLCTICGRDFAAIQNSYHLNDHVCEKCLRNQPPFSMARGIAYYEEPVKSLIHNLKYRFDTSAIAPLSRIAQSYDFSAFESCDIILPVPLHSRRLKKRGMNQALVFARLFFADSRKKIRTNIIKRNRHTTPQTELNAIGRRKNLKAAFSVQDVDCIKNKTICLVDDIYTTGITVTECAKTIMQAGAADVRVLTMARVREFR